MSRVHLVVFNERSTLGLNFFYKKNSQSDEPIHENLG